MYSCKGTLDCLPIIGSPWAILIVPLDNLLAPEANQQGTCRHKEEKGEGGEDILEKEANADVVINIFEHC